MRWSVLMIKTVRKCGAPQKSRRTINTSIKEGNICNLANIWSNMKCFINQSNMVMIFSLDHMNWKNSHIYYLKSLQSDNVVSRNILLIFHISFMGKIWEFNFTAMGTENLETTLSGMKILYRDTRCAFDWQFAFSERFAVIHNIICISCWN